MCLGKKWKVCYAIGSHVGCIFRFGVAGSEVEGAPLVHMLVAFSGMV